MLRSKKILQFYLKLKVKEIGKRNLHNARKRFLEENNEKCKYDFSTKF